MAFVRCGRLECGELLEIEAGGGTPRTLLRGSHGLSWIRWAPDSLRLLVHARRSLLLAELAGDVRVVARGYVGSYSFAPTSRDFVFERDSDLYRGSTYAPGVVRLTRGRRSAAPLWGPNDAIAFSRSGTVIDGGTYPSFQIWLMRPDGSGARRLTRRPLSGAAAPGLQPVAWSRDGTRLLAGYATEFSFAPFAVDVRTGRTRRLGRFPSLSYALGLSRDGRHALVETSKFDVARTETLHSVRLDGGASRVLARPATDGSWNR